MSNLNMLKRQHSEVLTIIDNIENLIMDGDLDANAKEISSNMNMMAGKLKMHLMSEDKFLYPNLMKSNRVEVRNIAQTFNNEMGNVSDMFTDFVQKHNTATKILQNKESFLMESKKIFKIIKDRISKEDCELYPLLED